MTTRSTILPFLLSEKNRDKQPFDFYYCIIHVCMILDCYNNETLSSILYTWELRFAAITFNGAARLWFWSGVL